MKNLLLASIVAILAAGARADAATATASIGVTVLGSGGSDPAASAVSMSAGQPFATDGAGRVAGSFLVSGASSAAYAVVVPSEIHATGPRGEIVVRPSEPGARSLPSSGRGETSVGFRADPSAHPAPGSYAGAVAVTLAYD